MFNSVRTRLTLWYAAVLALVLIVFAVVVYFLVAQTISQITDNAMRSAGDALIGVINAEKDEDDEPGKSNANMFNEKIQKDFRFRDLAFVVFDEKKNVVAESFNVNNQTDSQLPQFTISADQIPPEIIKNSSADKFQTFTLSDETKIKIYAQTINFNGQNYIVAVLPNFIYTSPSISKPATVLLANGSFQQAARLPSFLGANAISEYQGLVNAASEIDTSGKLRATLLRNQALLEAAQAGTQIARLALENTVGDVYFTLSLATAKRRGTEQNLDAAREF